MVNSNFMILQEGGKDESQDDVEAKPLLDGMSQPQTST